MCNLTKPFGLHFKTRGPRDCLGDAMRKLVLLFAFVSLLFVACNESGQAAADLTNMQAIGAAQTVNKVADGMIIDCDDRSQIKVQVLAPDLVRVRVAFQKSLPEQDHSWAIARTKWEPVRIEISETKDQFALETSELKVLVQRSPMRISFVDRKTGKLLNSDGQSMKFDPKTGAVAAIKSLGFEEHFYGLGEKAGHLDKRHDYVQMWSTDHYGYNWGSDPIYQSIPFYIGLLMDDSAGAGSWQGTAYGIFYDNSYRTHFDMSSSDPENVLFKADGGEMNYYFFYGPSMKKVLNRYTELTGRMPMPPKWALGNQQCRWSYANEQQVKDIVLRYEKEKIPLDAVQLDIHYMDGYRNFTWDRTRFPDPKKLTSWLASKGVKVVTIIDAGVKYEPGGKYETYNEGVAKGFFLKKSNSQLYVGKVWPGESVFVDYTLPDAAKWWGDKHRGLLDDGVAGIWNDMNEPADFESRDGDKWIDVVNYDEGRYSKHDKMRNLFAFLECKATYEGLQRLRPQERPYVITRSGYAGIQRYATMWTGDSNSTWSSLALCLPMFANLGLSGEPFVGADCGGFSGRADGELLTRWYQVAFLTPFLRNHHEANGYDQEPWRFGARYEDIIRKYVQLRYQLMPYLYTVLADAHATGVPWYRPLILENQNDYNAVSIEDEFLVGSSLLCAPIVKEGAVARDVYLPEGQWYDFYSGEKFNGRQTISVKAPLETVPLFVKAGSILPMTPVVDHLSQQVHHAPVNYAVYPDKDGRASGELYEDDGNTPAYLQGAFERFALDFKEGKLLSSSKKSKATIQIGNADYKVVGSK